MAERVGGAFYDRMAVENEATKNQKIRIGRRTAPKRHKKCNNQQNTSGIDGREMRWEERMMGAAGRERFDRCGGNRVGREGGTKVKSINLLKYIISQPIYKI